MPRTQALLLHEINKQSFIIYELAKRDFQHQYRGTHFGLIWMFAQPLVFIFVLYLVFTFGLKTAVSNEDVPFVLYLVTGVITWNYFSENFAQMAHIYKKHAFLVQKTDFHLSTLPLVQLISGLVSHLFLIFVAIGLCWWEGYAPSLYTLQIFYYLPAMQVLLLGLGWLTASTNVFVHDVSKIVEVTVQFGFWLTPIFWYLKYIPKEYHWIIHLNPVYYIVDGYRDSLINHIWFWEKAQTSLYYWCVSIIVILLGSAVYRRLRPHFSEVF